MGISDAPDGFFVSALLAPGYNTLVEMTPPCPSKANSSGHHTTLCCSVTLLHALQAWPVVLARAQAAVISLEKLAAQTGVTDVDEAMSRLTAGAARQPAYNI